MSKKKKTIKKYQYKKIRIDPLYQSSWFSKFINKFMLNGNKQIVEKIVYQSFLQIKKKFNRNPVRLLFISLIKTRPVFGFISKRVGAKWIRAPFPLEYKRQIILALKWLIAHTKTEPSRTLQRRLVQVFTQILKHKKTTLTKRYNKYFYELKEERIHLRYRWK